MDKIIELKDVSAGYDGRAVVNNISLTICHNDFYGIIGSNGAGKTTLIKVILGLLKPMSGSVDFYKDGLKVNHIDMGYLPQYSTIDKKFPISVFDVVLSGLNDDKTLFKSFSKTERDRTLEIIRKVGLEGYEKRPIGELSGGQTQRVLLARALAAKPEVLILDEPGTYIDKHFETQMLRLLEEANQHCTIILVTHNIDHVIQNTKCNVKVLKIDE